MAFQARPDGGIAGDDNDMGLLWTSSKDLLDLLKGLSPRPADLV
jgi:hypothetical protein